MELTNMGSSKSTGKQILVIIIAIIALLALFFAISVRKIGSTNGPDITPTAAPDTVLDDGSDLTLMADEEGEWYAYNADGMVDWDYTGLVTNEAGTWYVSGGKVAFDQSGQIIIDGESYNLQNGQIVT